MIRISWHRFVIAFLVCVVACFVSGGEVVANKDTQTVAGLDNLIAREKWAAAGLDRLSAAEQQSLADDISSLIAGSRTTQSSAAAARDRSQWRKLKRHMTKDDVRTLLGEPGRVSVSRFSESWYYVGGSVTFDSKGRVDMWSED